MHRFVVSATVLALAVGCSQGEQTVNSNDNQTPSNPTGTIVGFVTSLRTGQPLPGAAVTVPAHDGVRTTTTDSSGAYALGGLVAGTTYVVRFSAANHVAMLGKATVPSEAGDFPSNGIAQLDVKLAQANATLSGHVYARDGAPAAGVALSVDLRAACSLATTCYDLVTSAMTDAQGAYSLTGLPGAPTGLPLEVVAQPWDFDGDGLVDYDALARTAVTYPQVTSLLDVDLRAAVADLLLLTSNVESGSIVATAPIQLTFNRALDAAATSVSLYDQTAARTVAVTWSLDATSKILTVVPDGVASLAVYHSYSLGVAAVAANGATRSVSRTFTADATPALLPAVTGVVVNPASVDFDTAAFTLSWDAIAGASGYQVWLHDTSRNPDWLLAKVVGSSPAPSTTVWLPASFDYYSADTIQTPFAFGVGVSFAVVPVNAAGDAPSPTTATPVSRADTVAPAVLTALQSAHADNTAGTSAKTITLTLTFSEYMDTSVPPTITLPVAGETATFAWDPNRTRGVFTITIPAGVNGSGAYSVTGAKDTSGNAMAAKTGTLTAGPMQLVTNGGFETGDLTGWTANVTGTSTMPVTSSTVFASGAFSAQLGNTGTTSQSGYSGVYQTVTLPAGSTSIVASARYRPYYSYNSYGWDWSSCTIQNSAGTTLATLFTTSSSSSSFTPASVNITSLAGQTVRINCQTYQSTYGYVTGVYVDDVSIIATP